MYPSLPVHPTQLYSTVSAILLSIFLGRIFHRRKRHGVVFAWMMVLYPISRFILESIRTDNPLDVFGLTASQALSVVIFILGCLYLLFLYRFLPERSPRAIPFVPEEEEESTKARAWVVAC
jgi:phosphatidylglycerol:prolipoprotein diacylglycerol transferase